MAIGVTDTNQGGRVRGFCLSWWNYPAWGGFDPITLVNVDERIRQDIMQVLTFLSNSGSAVYPTEFREQIEQMQLIRNQGEFSDFHDGVAAAAYRKITGKDPDLLESWRDLEESLEAFGTGDSLARRALDNRRSLEEIAPFSSTEELVAVSLLLRAGLAHLANEFAIEGAWWNRYGNADERTRRVISRLLASR